MTIQSGYQLSSIAPYLSTPESLRHSLRRIADIGYQHVQLQGVPAEMSDQILADALEDTHLRCVALQEDFPFGFGENPERAIERALSCKAQYLCCALIPKEADTIEKLEQFAQRLSEIAEKVHSAGLIFAFHPIAPDFNEMEGQAVWERLMPLLPSHVQLTFCVHAAFQAGVDPIDIFEKYQGRIDLVHFKDDIALSNGARQLMPLGQGEHDWAPILDACRKADVKYVFAEQERWQKDAFICAEESFSYLRDLGL